MSRVQCISLKALVFIILESYRIPVCSALRFSAWISRADPRPDAGTEGMGRHDKRARKRRVARESESRSHFRSVHRSNSERTKEGGMARFIYSATERSPDVL